MEKQLTEQQAIEERAKYVAAFNDTMIKIWQEQITLLGVIDTGRLLQSPVAVRASADGKVSEVHLSQAFLEYGLWQDYGTGKEGAAWKQWRLGKAQSAQGLPLVLSEILYVRDEHQGVYGRFAWKTVPGHHF